MTRISGVAPKLLAGVTSLPVRARQLGISSKISSAPWRRQDSCDPRPEFRRRRLDGRPAHRLGDQRRDVALNLKHIVDVVGEALERLVVAEKAAREIERRQVLGAGHHRAKIRGGTTLRRRRRSRRDWRRGTNPRATASCAGRSRSGRVSAPCQIAAAPLGANRTLSRSPGAVSTRRRASAVAVALEKRRGLNGRVSISRRIASTTFGWPWPS